MNNRNKKQKLKQLNQLKKEKSKELNKNFYIYMSINDIDYFVGTLCVHSKLPKYEYSTFEYDKEWLNNKYAFPLGYDLPLQPCIFNSLETCNLKKDKSMFFSISFLTVVDKVDFYYEYLLIYAMKNGLIQKGEHVDLNYLYEWFKQATVTSPKFATNYATDTSLSLLNNFPLLNDYTRTGSIRYKTDKNGDFISVFDKNLLPKIDEIDDIIDIIEKVENNTENLSELKRLHVCVSSLDGRQPKSSVTDDDGNLYIAKLSAVKDKDTFFNKELLALILAKKYGIRVEEYSIHKTKDNKQFFLIKRFDREQSKRIPVMRMNVIIPLHKWDREKILVQGIKNLCKENYITNVQEFYKRLLFRVAIGDKPACIPNTCFLFDIETGWNISPDYDVTIGYSTITGGHSMPRKIVRKRLALKQVLKKAKYFKINKAHLRYLLKHLQIALKNWKTDALNVGFNEEELQNIRIFKEAFIGL